MHDILIIGGGIGGLTAAIALRQQGIAAAVYEAAPQLRAVGAGIWVPPNAMQIFDRLGLADAVQQSGINLRYSDILDAHSGLLQRTDIGAVAQRYGFPTVAIHRARLHQVLIGALDPAQLQLGKACTGIIAEQDRVRVRFADGHEAQARVVIGADGLRSVVRQHLFPHVTLRYSGQSSYRAIAPFVLPPAFAGVGSEIWGPGCRFGFSSISADEVYWYATLDAAPGALHGRTQVKQALAELFAAFPQPIALLIAATPDPNIFNTDIYDIRPLGSWRQGRVGLLGDAAHATTPNLGQGGAQAVEDAAMLAQCLMRQSDPEKALAAYEQRRRAKATMVVTRSWQLGKLAHIRNPLARAARNLLVRCTPPSVAQKQFERLFRVDNTPGTMPGAVSYSNLM